MGDKELGLMATGRVSGVGDNSLSARSGVRQSSYKPVPAVW